MPLDPLTEKLHSTTDAKVWAEEWVKVAKEIHVTSDNGHGVFDVGWMIGWFANYATVVEWEIEKRAIQRAIDVLNRVHQADPRVMPRLIDHRAPCNMTVADDPTVQVQEMKDSSGKPWVSPDGDAYEVGVLGIINGIFGKTSGGWGYIAADYQKGDDPERPDLLGPLNDFRWMSHYEGGELAEPLEVQDPPDGSS